MNEIFKGRLASLGLRGGLIIVPFPQVKGSLLLRNSLVKERIWDGIWVNVGQSRKKDLYIAPGSQFLEPRLMISSINSVFRDAGSFTACDSKSQHGSHASNIPIPPIFCVHCTWNNRLGFVGSIQASILNILTTHCRQLYWANEPLERSQCLSCLVEGRDACNHLTQDPASCFPPMLWVSHLAPQDLLDCNYFDLQLPEMREPHGWIGESLV